ncbi:MAG: type II secretion system F family protein [Cephaloticoccus sp.]|nr:type II secretion system F family protein [Cephaloticoccus sp.]
MASFAYTARDAQGKTMRDAVTAATRKEALRMLAARGLQPLELKEKSGASATARAGAILRGRRDRQPLAKDLLPFLQALTELTSSGLSPGEAVRLLANRMKEPRLRTLCGLLWDGLKEGQTLSLAMESMPRVFDIQAISLVRAAEATGSLNEVLQRLIVHHKEQRELRQKLTTALTYPLFVCIVAFGVILFFVFFLMPRLQGLLTSLGGKLPLSTQILVTGSELLVRYGIVIIPLAVIGIILGWRWHHTEKGRAIIDQQMVTLPLIRTWAIDTGVLAFVQTLAVLLENGINTVEALRLTERTVPNRSIRKALRQATERVLEGDSLSGALTRTGYFPDLVLDRLAVGESTGKLAPCLRDIAQHYAVRHTQRLQSMVGVIANGVLLFAFAFVGFLAYAIVAAVLRVSASFHF